MILHRLFHTLLSAVIVLASVIIYDAATYDPRLPIQEWRSVEVINSPIRAGDPLHVAITRDKIRDDCPVTSHRQAINLDGQSFRLEGATSEGGAVSSKTAHLMYPTPSNLPPGQYILRVHLSYACPEFTWPTTQPDGLFRVIGDNDATDQ